MTRRGKISRCRAPVRCYVSAMQKILVLGVTALIWNGCIEFEKQTMTFRHFAKSDTLVIWQQYEGIYGDRDRDGLNQEELDQLRAVRTTQRTFFFNNWIAEYDEKQFTETIERLQQELKKPKPEGDPALIRDSIALMQFIQKNITIKNGPFYLNAQGKLSATQEVTVRNIGKIIKMSNAVIRQTLTEEMARDGLDRENEKYRHLIEQSIEKRLEYITLKNGRLSFRWPHTAAQFKAIPQEVEMAKVIAQFQKAGGILQHANDEVRVSLGKPKAVETALGIVLPDNKYCNNAVKQVDALYGINRKYDPVAARKAFFAKAAKQFAK